MRTPAGKGKRAEKTKGRLFNFRSAIKKSIVRVKAVLIVWLMHLFSLCLVLMVSQSTNHILTVEAYKTC